MLCPYCMRIREPAPAIFGEGPCSPPHCIDHSCCADCPECSDWFAALEPEEGAVKHPKAEIPASSPIFITLSKEDQDLAVAVGTERYNTNVANNVRDRMMGNVDGLTAKIEGTAAEIAGARYLSVPPILEICKPDKKGGDIDCYFKSYSVDVKTSMREDGNLLSPPWRKKTMCDLYILATGIMPTYELHGWIEGEVLFQKENLTNKGHGPTYFLDRSKLKKMEDIFKIENKKVESPCPSAKFASPSKTASNQDPSRAPGNAPSPIVTSSPAANSAPSAKTTSTESDKKDDIPW